MKDLFMKVLSKYDEIPEDSDILYQNMINHQVDFEENIKEIVISQSGKQRKVKCVEKKSLEEFTLLYLKARMDEVFKIVYPDRSRTMREVFSFFTIILGMSDFVIFRYDFKDFFQSINSRIVFENKLKFSGLYRFEKDLIEKMVQIHKKCYPGLPTSNALVEIISKEFDIQIRSRLTELGLIYYARYIDDGILIFNKQVKEDEIITSIKDIILNVFKNSDVTLNYDKVVYISKKELYRTGVPKEFTYLGYRFILKSDADKIKVQYGISSEKIKKYKRKFKAIIRDYIINNNDELFKQRIQYLFSRIVFYNKFESKYSHKTHWDVIGIIANYCELRNYIRVNDKIIDETRLFLTDEFVKILDLELGSKKRPYFLRGKYSKSYTLEHRLLTNRSIIFHPHLGWSQLCLKEKIKKIDRQIKISKKPYRELVKIYCSLLKIHKEPEITP